jgi:hypothetical protein
MIAVVIVIIITVQEDVALVRGQTTARQDMSQENK